jgi:hypothetical protein
MAHLLANAHHAPLHVAPKKWMTIDLYQPRWLAAPSSRGYSTIPEGKLIMSDDSKPTKKATVSKSADEP